MYKPGKNVFTKSNKLAGRVENIVSCLVREFEPERIILFGSYARGDYTKDSTIDLLIIADTDERFLDRIKKALLSCRGQTPSIDPLVYTPDEFTSLIEQGEGFIDSAIDEGIIIYEKENEDSNPQ